MAQKKVVYFTAGRAATVAEQAEIDYLNTKINGAYSAVVVRNAAANTEYGNSATDDENVNGVGTLEAADLVAGAVPSGYSGDQVVVVPKAGQPDALIVAPQNRTFAHTATLQLAAVKLNADGTLTDATATAVWSTSDASKATVVAGLVTGVAAGTATITARINSTDNTAHTDATTTITLT